MICTHSTVRKTGAGLLLPHLLHHHSYYISSDYYNFSSLEADSPQLFRSRFPTQKIRRSACQPSQALSLSFHLSCSFRDRFLPSSFGFFSLVSLLSQPHAVSEVSLVCIFVIDDKLGIDLPAEGDFH